MATENVTKMIPFVAVGTTTGDVGVSKLVIYAIVNTNTPAPPPTPVRRARVSLIYGKTEG
jgi:hypothetical protein